VLPVRAVVSVCDGLYLPVCWSDGFFFFVVLRFFPVFFSIGVYFVVPHSWCDASRLLMEFFACSCVTVAV
jgi:hypothetical protein